MRGHWSVHGNARSGRVSPGPTKIHQNRAAASRERSHQARQAGQRVGCAVVPEREAVGPGHGHDEIPDADARRAQQQAPHQDRVRRGAPHPARDRDKDAARADAEQRQPDDEKRVVVEELERDDPRVADFEQKAREADQEDLDVVAAARRVGLSRRSALSHGGATVAAGCSETRSRASG